MAVRPIDANVAMKKIREYMKGFPNANTRLAACRAILSMLGDKSQIPTLTPQNEWISVAERLPHRGGHMMDIEKLIEAVKLCGSTPKVDQCKQCIYWAGGDMSKCIPRMTIDAATALTSLQTENEKLWAMLEQVKAEKARDIETLSENLRIAYQSRDAAVEDLRKLAHEYCVCYACKNDKFDYDKACCTGCRYHNGNNWQWRGPKED